MASLLESKVLRGRVHCPICTRTVEAEVVSLDRGWNRKMRVAEGQKCPRCSAPLDAAYVLDVGGSLSG